MSDKKGVIEINGNMYDAKSGHPASADQQKQKKPIKPLAMDGMVHATKKKRAKAKHAHNVHTVAKKSVTLNRKGLTKPTPARRHEIQKKKPVTARKPSLETGEASLGVSPTREERARSVQKSTVISKFGQEPTTRMEIPDPAALASLKPVAETTVAPAITTKQPVAPQTTTTQSDDMIAQAMESLAASNTQSAVPIKSNMNKPKGKLIQDVTRRFGSGSVMKKAGVAMALFLVAGYGIYTNVPNIALRVAASKAGFEASMPGYQPAGFNFSGPVSYSPGQITIEYNSSTDGRTFRVTERETNWDSQSLLDNYISTKTELYQTFQERGLTIYVYEDNKASWVNGGIWYTISGDSGLNTEQLIRIASSL